MARGGTANDILSLHLFEGQNLVPRELLQERLLEAIAKAVNAQGVFLNEKSNAMHKRNALEFVSGLGPQVMRFLAGNPETVGVGSRERLGEILKDYPVRFFIFERMNKIYFHLKK